MSQSIRSLASPWVREADHVSIAGVLFVLASAAGFSLQGLFAKEAYAAGANTITVGFGRFAIASTILWGYAAARHARGSFPLRLPARTTGMLLALGGIGYFLGSLTYLGAVFFIPVSLAGLLLYTYPAIATALSLSLGDKRITRRLATGLATTLAGVVVVLGAPLAVVTHGIDWRGIALIISSATLYATYIVAGERSLHGVHTVLAMAYIALGATISFAALTLVTWSFTPRIGLGGWSAIAGIGLVSTVVAAGAFLAALRRLGPARAATLCTVEPLFTVIFAAIILGERLSSGQLLGGLIILIGVLIVLRERREPGPDDLERHELRDRRVSG